MEFVKEEELIEKGYKKHSESLFSKNELMGISCFIKCSSCKRWSGPIRANKNQNKVALSCSFCNDNDSYVTTEVPLPGKRIIIVGQTGVSY